MSAAEIRARVSFCQFRPWLRLSPRARAAGDLGPHHVRAGGLPGRLEGPSPSDQRIRARERISHRPPDLWRSLGRQEGRGSVWVGAGPGEALWGRRGVDEISGCAEVSFQPACLGSRKVIATPNTLLNEAQPARTSRCLPAFFPVGGNSPS